MTPLMLSLTLPLSLTLSLWLWRPLPAAAAFCPGALEQRVTSTLNRLDKQSLGSLEVEDFSRSVLLFVGAVSVKNSCSSKSRTDGRSRKCFMLKRSFPLSPNLCRHFCSLPKFFSRKPPQEGLFEGWRCSVAAGSSPPLRDSAVNTWQLLLFFCVRPLGSLSSFLLLLCSLSLSASGKIKMISDFFEGTDICRFPQHLAPCSYSDNSLRGFFGNIKTSSRATGFILPPIRVANQNSLHFRVSC